MSQAKHKPASTDAVNTQFETPSMEGWSCESHIGEPGLEVYKLFVNCALDEIRANNLDPRNPNQTAR